MSIIDEVMVFLDDQDGVELSTIKKNLSKKTNQIIASTLGRLSSRGWVEKIKDKKTTLYKISKSGRYEITKMLNHIKQFEKEKWDNSFIFVVFNIPERMRKFRDQFRRELTENGFTRVQSDLWVSFWDIKDEIIEIVKNLNIEKNTTIIKIEKVSEKTTNVIIEGMDWDDKELNKRYNEFISDAQKFLKISHKTGFTARCLVFEFAKILSFDPIFPEEFRTKKYLGTKAFNLYSKIRPYCYK